MSSTATLPEIIDMLQDFVSTLESDGFLRRSIADAIGLLEEALRLPLAIEQPATTARMARLVDLAARTLTSALRMEDQGTGI